jgi:hypothetical protein
MTEQKKSEPTATMCPECCSFAVYTVEDQKDNEIRLKEVAEFYGKDKTFNFNFRLTCPHCGPVFFGRLIKNVKFTKEASGDKAVGG